MADIGQELFKQLPDRLKQGRLNSVSSATKKRHNQSMSIGSPTVQPSRSTPHIGTLQTDCEANAAANFQRSSTFPPQSNPWKSMPQTSMSSRLNQPTVRDYDAEYRNSQAGFTPSKSDIMAPQSPESMGSGVLPPSASRSTFGFPQSQSYPGQGLPDFSAIMFPSANPFAYPNQPLTTLESRYPKQEDTPDSMDISMVKSSPGIQAHASFDNDHEVQLLEPIPPYMMQGQRPTMQRPQVNLLVDMSRENQGRSSIPFGGELDGWPTQEPRLGGISAMNLDEVFGGNWNADWTNEEFRQ